MVFKKLICIALSAAVLINIMCVCAYAASYGDFEFEIVDNSAEVLAYKGNAKDVEIPEKLGGFSVESIGEDAFRKSGVNSVSMPNCVKKIKKSAFADCASLETVDFSLSLESIGETAFYNCAKLSSAVRFPKSLKTIGSSAFENCWNMTYAIVPESVESIDYCALGYYYDSDKTDKKYYDYKRSDFRILGYPDSAAYTYCQKQSIDFYDITSGATAITSGGMDFFINSKGEAELTSYSGTSYTPSIPSKIGLYPVRFIGDYAFFASSIRDVKIPDSVIKIGVWAFESCESIIDIKIPPSVSTIGEGALGYCYEDGVDLKYDGFTVCGAKNSAAEAYAKKNGFNFKDVYTTSLSLSKTSGKLYLKGTLNIKAKVVNPNGKTTYTCADKKIAKVNSSGKVTGLKAGKTKITVSNNGVKKTFTVTVKNPTLSSTDVTINRGKIYQLKITGRVGNAKFISGNTKILKVNEKTGKYKGLKKGKAKITVKTNGIKLKCKVTVK